jgi:hypothetical protein
MENDDFKQTFELCIAFPSLGGCCQVTMHLLSLPTTAFNQTGRPCFCTSHLGVISSPQSRDIIQSVKGMTLSSIRRSSAAPCPYHITSTPQIEESQTKKGLASPPTP